eukprot:1655386-Rhodomonas_salina.1
MCIRDSLTSPPLPSPHLTSPLLPPLPSFLFHSLLSSPFLFPSSFDPCLVVLLASTPKSNALDRKPRTLCTKTEGFAFDSAACRDQSWGYHVVPPASKLLACNDYGYHPPYALY